MTTHKGADLAVLTLVVLHQPASTGMTFLVTPLDVGSVVDIVGYGISGTVAQVSGTLMVVGAAAAIGWMRP